jgi:AcrR family transcriptional regulator
MRTQRERVEESARRLAEAAIELIAERGFSQTTSKEIGLRAGYSRAMVAERFGSKEALLDFVLEQYYEERIGVDVTATSSGLDALLSPIVALKSFAQSDPDTLRAMFVLNFEAVHNTDVLRTRVRSRLRRLRDELAEAARMGQADGSVHLGANPSDIAADVMATGIGHAYAWVVGLDDGDFIATLTRWFSDTRSALAPD